MPFRLTIKIPSRIARKLGARLIPAVERAVAASMPTMADLAIDTIGRAADSALHTTAPTYKAGLQVVDTRIASNPSVRIALVGALPTALENGFSAFDIKAALLAAAKHFDKDGQPYVDVPFRHGLDSGSVHFPGMPASIAAAIGRALGKEQKRLKVAGASAMEVTTANARLRAKTPGRSFTRNMDMGHFHVRAAVEHKQGIYDGMKRSATMGASKAIGSYSTFRRISPNSSATSWWHPGFAGVRLFTKVLPTLEPELQSLVMDAIRAELKR